MPRLTDDVLLLAVGDRARFRTRGSVGVVLAAAELCDHALAGRAMPVAPSAVSSHRGLVEAIRSDSVSADDRVGQRLVSRGLLAPAEHRVLGLFTRRGYAVVDEAARHEAEHRLRRALEPGAGPDAWTATFVLLCAVSGIARAVAPPPREALRRRAVAEHLNGLRPVVGGAVADVIDATRAVFGRSGGSDGGFVPVSGTDCYGDSGGDGAGGDGGGDGGGGGGD